MKKVANALIIFFFILAGVQFSDLKNARASDGCKLYFDLYYEPNLLSNLYSVDIYLDDIHIGKIAQGKAFTSLVDTETGDHTVMFIKSEDNGVYGQKTLSLSGDSTFSCKLHAHSNKVEIKEYQLNSEINGASLLMPNVCLLNLQSAKSQLSKAGFININTATNNGGSIWNEDTWTVISQNIEAGSTIDKNEKIVLTCQPTDSFLDKNFLQKTVYEAIETNSDLGYVLQYLNTVSFKDMTDDVSGMNTENLALWKVGTTKMENVQTNTVTLGVYYIGDVIMPEVTGISLEKAYTILRSNNFSNIAEAAQDGSFIWNNENWKVIEQSHPAGSPVNAAEKILLSCISYSAEKTAIASGQATMSPTATPYMPEAANTPIIVQTSDEPDTVSAQIPAASSVDSEFAKRAAVTALTNYYALDVYNSDGITYDSEKFHSYSDTGGNINDYYILVEDWGEWNETGSGIWSADGLILNRVGYNFLPELSLKVGCNENQCTVYNLRDSSGNLLANTLNLDETNIAFMVPMALIAEGRTTN